MSAPQDHLAIDIEKSTIQNDNYRLVIYTGDFQLVLMSLEPSESIPWETHHNLDQFIRVESGFGRIDIIQENNGIKSLYTYQLVDGTAIVVPAGLRHKIINTKRDKLKLYSIYSSPEHSPNRLDVNQPSVE